MGAKGAELAAALLLAAAWASCGGEDGPARCDEALGYVCRAGGGGAAGSGGAGGGGAPAMGEGGAGQGGGGAGGSGGLVCTAPAVDCAGTCVNVKADDAANCGACGRSCLGTATCAAGACVPEAMTSVGEVAPYALADGGAFLYWVSPATKAGIEPRVRRAPKTSPGGAGEAVFASTDVRARSLAFAGGKLYWGDLGANPSDTNQNIFSGTPGELVTQLVEASQRGVQSLALAGGKIYWSLTGGSALRGKLLTAAPGVFDPNVFGQEEPTWVAADGDGVPYWVALDAAGTGREVRRAVSASAAEKVVSGGAALRAVTLFGERFYWADGAALRSAPRASPTESRLELEGLGAVEGFAVVAASGAAGGPAGSGGAAGAGGAAGVGAPALYALTADGRRLKVWRKGPDEAPLLLGEVTAKAADYAGNPFGAAYLLVDDDYVYFADVGGLGGLTPQGVPISLGDGAVYRVAR